jgi:hypothetical protein
VEARRIIESLHPDTRGDYPEDAYSRYLAGFCLEMIGDDSNAAVQYRKAAELAPAVIIDEQTGWLRPGETGAVASAAAPGRAPNGSEAELVCILQCGWVPRGNQSLREALPRGGTAYAEIYHGGTYLGRSHNLSDTADLAFTTAQIEEARKVAKSVARVVVKEAIAESVEHYHNEALGDLVRVVLIGLFEQPDTRRWETLPRRLQVARVSCPEDLEEFEIVFKDAAGRTMSTRRVRQPITRRGRTLVSICREVKMNHE